MLHSQRMYGCSLLTAGPRGARRVNARNAQKHAGRLLPAFPPLVSSCSNRKLNHVNTPALFTAGLAPLAEDAARTPNRACRLPPGPCLLWCSSPGCRTKRAAEQVRCMSVHSRAWRRRWRHANSSLCCAHGRAPSRPRRPMSAMQAPAAIWMQALFRCLVRVTTTCQTGAFQ